MTPSFASWDDRVLDLATSQATEGLDAAGRRELEGAARSEDLAEFERAVAAIHLAGLVRLEEPPAAVVDRLQRTARAEASPSQEGTSRQPVSLSLVLGWATAAALLLALLWPSGQLSAIEQRDALIAAGAEPIPWAAQDPLAASVTGDVVWSDDSQEGYMRFEGLAQNDPSEAQYQLWIFDPSRDQGEEFPTDGGVFDVRGGEVVIPIDAKLDIGRATLFAVTLESPGGVVVSRRDPLLLTAAVPQ